MKILLFLLLLMPTGCKKEDISEAYKPDSIHVSKESLTLKVGESEQLKASPLPATAKELTFQWMSANPAVATVSNGLVSAVAVGETVVTVGYANVKTDVAVKVNPPDPVVTGTLYDKTLSNKGSFSELLLNGAGQLTENGLSLTAGSNTVKLNKFYALAERKVQYTVRFSADAKALFKSSEGDFNACIDVPNKRISIATSPVTQTSASFLKADSDYLIEIYHIYQQSKVKITDVQSGESAEVSATMDGQGGVGQGVVNPGFSVGMQWDYYCFGLQSGTSMLVKKITVLALKSKVKLLIYGDSVSQPEGYFPTADFQKSWTQQIISRLNGNGMSSGRGGGTIDTVLDYIKNELPFIETEYVMVGIGTNGGNTEAKLSQLVEYIRLHGAIPILNNVPCNESGTQVEINLLIAKIREKYGLKGCKFDWATSLNGDGKEVDKSMMYWENYTNGWGDIYHHPNEIGGQKMFERTLMDVPEIYESTKK
ncbi:MAG: Ig-like domain-containing protein [Dysgonamonadaceae bacterium]|jgi:hypothetical protein|nr:Ig-like domain-containing protein [Dysgonamonadaceae bacterium]